MKAKLLICNGQVWTEEGALEVDVLVGEDGRVLRLIDRNAGADGEELGCAERYDAAGMWVLPGAIDAHVHFREPGLTEKEDFLSGSKGAALGGVTTVLDMPNTIPPVSDAEGWLAKAEQIAGRSYVDYALFTAAVDDGDASAGDLVAKVGGAVDAGAIGVKVFLGPTTGDIRAPDWGRLYALCRELAGSAVFTFHCEDRDVIDAAARQRASLDPGSYASLLEVRPRFGEILATAGALRLAASTGARVHIAHVALKEAVLDIQVAKEQGAAVTAETCPQYLFLSAEEYRSFGAMMKVLPPIRSGLDQTALWEGIVSGAVDVVATDHAPHLGRAKEQSKAVWEGAFGMAGVQTLVPLMIDAAISGRCTPADVVRWTSSNPAKAFGLFPAKGSLSPGADADIAIIDPNATWRVDDRWWASKSDNTAFWGRTGRGKPVATFVRGELVASGGDVIASPIGRLLKPSWK